MAKTYVCKNCASVFSTVPGEVPIVVEGGHICGNLCLIAWFHNRVVECEEPHEENLQGESYADINPT